MQVLSSNQSPVTHKLQIPQSNPEVAVPIFNSQSGSNQKVRMSNQKFYLLLLLLLQSNSQASPSHPPVHLRTYMYAWVFSGFAKYSLGICHADSVFRCLDPKPNIKYSVEPNTEHIY